MVELGCGRHPGYLYNRVSSRTRASFVCIPRQIKPHFCLATAVLVVGPVKGAKPFQKLSLVVPTYNEAQNILELVCGLHAALAEIPSVSYEIIVVDDDSPDQT